MTFPANNTLLVLTGAGVPPYSARGATQSLTPIDASKQMRRTVNGTLTDVSASQFRKYSTSISCADQDPPALDGIWPGALLTVQCIAELCRAIATSDPHDRPVVDGSGREADGFYFYRPILQILVTGFQISRDEYGAVVSWQLDGEEV